MEYFNVLKCTLMYFLTTSECLNILYVLVHLLNVPMDDLDIYRASWGVTHRVKHKSIHRQPRLNTSELHTHEANQAVKHGASQRFYHKNTKACVCHIKLG